MKKLLALVDGVLSDLRRSRIAAAPADRVTLAPVWVTPMVSRAEEIAAGPVAAAR